MLLRTALATLALLGTSVYAADGVWKWVDAQGVTHYSDRPVPGAERVDIKTQSSYSTPPATPTPAAPASSQPPSPLYREIEVWRPSQDEAIINTGGVVPVRVRLDPQLRPRHTLAIYLDGRRVDDAAGTDGSFELSEVPRGTHSIVAAVVDERGNILQQSPAVIFHMRQHSIAQPPVGPTLRPPTRP